MNIFMADISIKDMYHTNFTLPINWAIKDMLLRKLSPKPLVGLLDG